MEDKKKKKEKKREELEKKKKNGRDDDETFVIFNQKFFEPQRITETNICVYSIVSSFLEFLYLQMAERILSYRELVAKDH